MGGAGNEPKQEIIKPKIGGGVMNGLDELEDLS